VRYNQGMALPLTIAILVFTLLLGLAAYTIARLLARQDRMSEEVLRISREYADTAISTQKSAAAAHAKQASGLIEALAGATEKTITSVASSMNAIYGPAVVDRTAAEGSGAEPLSPWYTKEGSMDYSDPTDTMNVEGLMGPEQNDTHDGLVLDDEPFGVPGLKIGA